MKKTRAIAWIAVSLFFLTLTCTVWGQGVGSLQGQVTDPSGAAIAAKPGYPTVIVPFGLVPNSPAAPAQPFPEGFAAKPTPFGVGFTGMACSEPRLIEFSYAFEQATKRRVSPPSAP